jgi:hypothetical protein
MRNPEVDYSLIIMDMQEMLLGRLEMRAGDVSPPILSSMNTISVFMFLHSPLCDHDRNPFIEGFRSINEIDAKLDGNGTTRWKVGPMARQRYQVAPWALFRPSGSPM